MLCVRSTDFQGSVRSNGSCMACPRKVATPAQRRDSESSSISDSPEKKLYLTQRRQEAKEKEIGFALNNQFIANASANRR